jgi:hypothetical protein
MRHAIMCCLAIATAASAASFNVRDYGAVGDGTTKDTAAMQKAIDACAEAGGGRVVLPAGRYLSGSLALKSRVALVIEKNAVLLGSKDIKDFHGPLLGAEGQESISLEGEGTVDGQGDAYWEKVRDENRPLWRGTAQHEYKALKRPSFVRFTRCTDVRVRGVTLTGSPSWTLHLLRCERVLVEGVTIRNPLYGPNTDGIDVNSCIDVTIRTCDIVTGDDGIVLKSTEPGRGHPSRKIHISDCRIWSACNGLKIGTETHDDFSDIIMRDCHVYSDSDNPRERTISGIAIESVDGSHLRDILVENITMDKVRTPIFVRLGHRGGNSKRNRQVEPRVPGTIEDVVIRNVKATNSMFESSITGIPDHPVRKLLLENVDLGYEGGGAAALMTDDVPDQAVIARYPEATMFGRLPAYGLFLRHVQDTTLRNVTCRTTAPDARPMLVCDDVQDLVCDTVNAAQAPAEFPVVWLSRVRGIQFRNCTAPTGTQTFVAHEGAETDRVDLVDCDTTRAQTPLRLLPPGGLFSEGSPVMTETSAGLFVIDPAKMRLIPPMKDMGDGVETPANQGRDLGAAICRLQVTTPGEYVAWVRVLAPSGESNSFYLSLDRDKPFLSDVDILGEWHWARVRDRTDGKSTPEGAVTVSLDKGEHVLRLRNRETGTRIQRIVLASKALAFDPARLP